MGGREPDIGSRLPRDQQRIVVSSGPSVHLFARIVGVLAAACPTHVEARQTLPSQGVSQNGTLPFSGTRPPHTGTNTI
jgi:hypothetical protein